jgi:hypothetical protein
MQVVEVVVRRGGRLSAVGERGGGGWMVVRGRGRKGDRGGMKRVEFLEMVMAGFGCCRSRRVN